ncbi:hypothetical protein MSG28_012682 [Choristoneura fumiferana]|uniref:Uncharacterized protein n=1 Tax=Choristoneura fumiferana TaxID=7141 RepID=A0ACC0JHN2_CHOFU|nr:hypothetical protein MSG28_012682 [Choristoneura fumiferana]
MPCRPAQIISIRARVAVKCSSGVTTFLSPGVLQQLSKECEGEKRRIEAFSRTFSRVKITYNPQYSTVMTFYNAIEKPVDIYQKLGVRRYFKEMLKSAILLCAGAHVPGISGIFTTCRQQQIAEELGFQKYHEIFYDKYKVEDEYTFAIKPLMDINRLCYIYWLEAFSRTFSRVKITYNPQYSTVMTFYNAIEKPVDIYQKLGVRRYFKELKGFRLEFNNYELKLSQKESEVVRILFCIALLDVLEQIKSRLTNCQGDAKGGFPSSSECQHPRCGWHIYHWQYAQESGRVGFRKIVFWDTGLGNYGAALMAYRLPNVEEPPELKKQQSSRFNVQLENIEGDDND